MRWILITVVVGVLAVSSGGCGGEPGLAASFDYVVPARFKVPDLRASEDQGEYEVYADGPLHPDTWVVRLNACASTGSIVKYSWRIDGESVGVETACDGFEYEFPAEGSYSVTLVVEDSDGEEDVHRADIVVRDLLIFGVGDSYGSGEGNPDVDASGEPLGDVGGAVGVEGVQWQNWRCHRSALSGQVRAARLIEEADPHTSVTFVHLACSGGRVHRGLLGEYLGIEEDGDPFPPQIDRVAELAGEHEIDALFLSIGGNDVNFANVVEACILGEVCHEDDPVPDPTIQGAASLICSAAGSFADECEDYLGGVPDADALDARTIFDIHSKAEDVDGQDIGQDGHDDLPNNYRDLAQEIVGTLGMDPGRVYLTEIPDVTRDEHGQTCGWPTEFPSSISDALRVALQELPGVTQTEMSWSSTHVTVQLHAAMQAAAEEHGWQFVEGVDSRFEGHGYCASFPWLVRLQNTFQIQGDKNGALHPNVPGHGAYAAAIVEAFDPAQ
jgi:PKD repeat protein